MKNLKLMNIITEGFSEKEGKLVMKAIYDCFQESGPEGIRRYKTVNEYLGTLPFEVDASDVEIGNWEATEFAQTHKVAPVKLQGEIIGYLHKS
jgi:hypothetical protein